jgi:hypothetical protein
MNFARVAASAVVAWIVSVGVGFVVNNVLLADLYTANAAAMRPEQTIMANVPLGFGATLVAFFAFAYVYAKGYEGTNGTMEGIRFGVLVAVMLSGFAVVWQYVVYPISGPLAAAMIVDTFVETTLYGAIVGTIYKPTAKRAYNVAAV